MSEKVENNKGHLCEENCKAGGNQEPEYLHVILAHIPLQSGHDTGNFVCSCQFRAHMRTCASRVCHVHGCVHIDLAEIACLLDAHLRL